MDSKEKDLTPPHLSPLPCGYSSIGGEEETFSTIKNSVSHKLIERQHWVQRHAGPAPRLVGTTDEFPRSHFVCNFWTVPSDSNFFSAVFIFPSNS